MESETDLELRMEVEMSSQTQWAEIKKGGDEEKELNIEQEMQKKAAYESFMWWDGNGGREE